MIMNIINNLTNYKNIISLINFSLLQQRSLSMKTFECNKNNNTTKQFVAKQSFRFKQISSLVKIYVQQKTKTTSKLIFQENKFDNFNRSMKTDKIIGKYLKIKQKYCEKKYNDGIPHVDV